MRERQARARERDPRPHPGSPPILRSIASVTVAIAVLACATCASAFTAPPGAFDANATTATVCARGYARAHRKVPYRLKDRIYRAYGLARGHRRGYVLDHLVPLELGGINSMANLWPQTLADAHRKDLDENRLHGEVCAGETSLAAARAEIVRLWRR